MGAAGEPEDSFLGLCSHSHYFKMPKKANIFESFSHSAIQQFKEAFGIMDTDKDGLLSSSDLTAAFAAHGKNIGGGEAQAMLDEVDGPMNFTQMVTLFASKMAGGSDDDDVILASFDAFEMDGKIDADAFRHSLMTFGVKFSASEVDDAFAEMKIDEGMIDAAHLGPDGVKVNIFRCFLIKASRTELSGRSHTEKILQPMILLLDSHPRCGNSHSFCEKSSSPSSIRDSPLGSMKIY